MRPATGPPSWNARPATIPPPIRPQPYWSPESPSAPAISRGSTSRPTYTSDGTFEKASSEPTAKIRAAAIGRLSWPEAAAMMARPMPSNSRLWATSMTLRGSRRSAREPATNVKISVGSVIEMVRIDTATAEPVCSRTAQTMTVWKLHRPTLYEIAPPRKRR